MSRNIYVLTNIQLTSDTPFMSNGKIVKGSKIALDSSINGNINNEDYGVESDILLVKSGVLRSGSIISQFSILNISKAFLGNIDNHLFVDVTEMSGSDKVPSAFLDISNKYSELMKEKEELISSLDLIRDEMRNNDNDFLLTKNNYQQRIVTLQKENTDLTRMKDYDESEFLKEESEILKETKLFKEKLISKENEVSNIESRILKLDSLFEDFVRSYTISNNKAKATKELLDNLNDNLLDISLVTIIKQGISSVIMKISEEIETSNKIIKELKKNDKYEIDILVEGLTDQVILSSEKDNKIKELRTKLDSLVEGLTDQLFLSTEKDNNIKELRSEIDILVEGLTDQVILSSEKDNSIKELSSRLAASEKTCNSLNDALMNTFHEIHKSVNNDNSLEMAVLINAFEEENKQRVNFEIRLRDAMNKIREQGSEFDALKLVFENLENTDNERDTLRSQNEELNSEIQVLIKAFEEYKLSSVIERDNLKDSFEKREKEILEKFSIITERFANNEDDLRKEILNKDIEYKHLTECLNSVAFSHEALESDIKRLKEEFNLVEVQLHNANQNIAQIESISNSEDTDIYLVIKELSLTIKDISHELENEKRLAANLQNSFEKLESDYSKEKMMNEILNSKIHELNLQHVNEKDALSQLLSEHVENCELSIMIKSLIELYMLTKNILDVKTIDFNSENEFLTQVVKQQQDKITELESTNVEHSNYNRVIHEQSELITKLELQKSDQCDKINELREESDKFSSLAQSLALKNIDDTSRLSTRIAESNNEIELLKCKIIEYETLIINLNDKIDTTTSIDVVPDVTIKQIEKKFQIESETARFYKDKYQTVHNDIVELSDAYESLTLSNKSLVEENDTLKINNSELHNEIDFIRVRINDMEHILIEQRDKMMSVIEQNLPTKVNVAVDLLLLVEDEIVRAYNLFKMKKISQEDLLKKADELEARKSTIRSSLNNDLQNIDILLKL